MNNTNPSIETREIKFRAWDKETKRMYDVYAIDWDGDHKIISCHISDDEDIRKVYPNEKYGDQIDLMQYTGLKDKNGVEIFEGDILGTDTKAITNLIVRYVGWRWVATSFRHLNRKVVFISPAKIRKYEVIGNVYENPNLSKETK